MPRQAFADIEVLKAISDLVESGFTGPAQIRRHLEPRFGYRLPSLRTVQRIVKQLMPPDPSGRWSLADADPEDARNVLDVLAVIVERTEGRVWPTRDLADWIVKVRAAAPTLPPWDVYLFAVFYRRAQYHKHDTRTVDLQLAFKTWESSETLKAHVRAMVRWQDNLNLPPVTIGDPWAEWRAGEMPE